MKNRLAVLALFVVSAAVESPVGFGAVLISQVYPGGGNSGATYNSDFIVLFNAGPSGQALNGWSVQYAFGTSSSWAGTALPNVVLQAGQSFLIEEQTGLEGAALTSPDVMGTLNFSTSSGKIALVSTSTLLTGACPNDSSIVDFVGYGSSANCYEGFNPTSNPANNTNAVSRNARCIDTNDNAADFGLAGANPLNSQTQISICAGGVFAQLLTTPASIRACEPVGDATAIYGQVEFTGVTDSIATPAPGVLAELGVGPSGTDPATAPGWRWLAASPDSFYDFSQNNDQYLQLISAHASGTYDYAYRFSYQSQPYLYADGDSTSNGYSPSAAGKLTVVGNVLYCDRFDVNTINGN